MATENATAASPHTHHSGRERPNLRSATSLRRLLNMIGGDGRQHVCQRVERMRDSGARLAIAEDARELQDELLYGIKAMGSLLAAAGDDVDIAAAGTSIESLTAIAVELTDLIYAATAQPSGEHGNA